jgi:DNA-binding NarL/FixJ family response regulator
MRTSLTGAGYEVDDAKTGEEALDKVREFRPDLVLLDINMPGMGGIDTCKAIRMDPNVAIIMLTVHNTEAAKVEALDAGADEYVVKPFEARALQARVTALARRSSAPPDASGNASWMSGARTPTERQAEVMRCLAQGLANKEIATTLGCSVKNVEYHVGRILRKTNCSSRTELIARVRQRRTAGS